MEFEATLDTLTTTVATFSVPTATKLRDASIPASAVVVVTADANTFRALEWTAGKRYVISFEGTRV